MKDAQSLLNDILEGYKESDGYDIPPAMSAALNAAEEFINKEKNR